MPFPICLVAWQVDILHPYAKLKWRECWSLPVRMRDAQAVWLGDKLYVGGGATTGSRRDMARLYIYTSTTDTWSYINTPVCSFALVTYHSQLVLVGGWVLVGDGRVGSVTNKLWTLTEHDQWRETLPPMTTKRYSLSAVEFADRILVAGGWNDKGRSIDFVEVYNGYYWAETRRLPKPFHYMKSTVLNGHWYLMGGYEQEEEVYYASLDSLIVTYRSKSLLSVWKRLSNVLSSTTVFGNRLIAVGGGDPASSSIHAYSPHTQSWVHVGDMPVELDSTCTAVLPTGDLMVIGGRSGTSIKSSVHNASLIGN